MTVGTDAPFSSKTILVQGATGAVGSLLVEELLTAGAKVGIAVRKAWQVKKVLERFGGTQQRLLVSHVESLDSEAAAGFVKGVTDSLGPIDGLISTAGSFRQADVGKDKSDDALRLIEANYLSVVTLVRAVVTPMKRRKTGSLVFTGAAAVDHIQPGISSYLAAKAALHMYARCLDVELKPAGLRVAVVAPQTLDTEANRAAMPEADRAGWVDCRRVVKACLDLTLGRVPTPVSEDGVVHRLA